MAEEKADAAKRGSALARQEAARLRAASPGGGCFAADIPMYLGRGASREYRREVIVGPASAVSVEYCDQGLSARLAFGA